MRNRYLVIFFLFLIIRIQAQDFKLTENAEISVLTIGPGTNLNDAFGHNAFRISDITFDYIFDYGRFDFNAPNFYTEFAQGKLNYWIGVSYYEDFLENYIIQNRWVKEQVLDLSHEEKQQIFNYLMTNAKPENKFYLYDFFFDNCATKIKDVAQDVLKESVKFNTPEDLEPKSFRSLIYSHVNRNTWGSLGIDISLGSVIDKKATPEEHMFLPVYIYDYYSSATKEDNRLLVKESKVLFQNTETAKKNNFFLSPLFVFSIISFFIIFITYNDIKKVKRSKWLDIILFATTGLIGLALLLLWFATDHTATAFNYNLLWAFVLNVFVIGQVIKNKVRSWFRKYLKLLIILLCLLTLHWIIGIQVFAISLIPLLIAFLIRYVYLIRHFKTNLSN